jgi:hypothetical protein
MRSNGIIDILGRIELTKNYFILHNFWPILKFLQVLGLFPCKKVRDENGLVRLQPMKTWISITLFFTWSLILAGPPMGIQSYLHIKDKSGILRTSWKTYKETSEENTIRQFVTYFQTISTSCIQTCLIWTNISRRHVLCKIQDEFSVMFDGKDLTKSSVNSIVLGLNILTMLLFVLYYLSSVFSFSLLMKKSFENDKFSPQNETNPFDNRSFLFDNETSLTNKQTHLILKETYSLDDDNHFGYSLAQIACFAWIPYVLFFVLMLSQFFILYFQLCYNIKNLLIDFKMNGKSSAEVLKFASKINKCVRMTSSFFSVQCFTFIAMALILMISNVYLLLDYAMSSETSKYWFAQVTFFLGSLCSALVLWILNKQSEDIKQDLRKLKEDMRNLSATDDFVEINGNFHLESYARRNLIDTLSEFQGFDACGFATLGKPLLSSIFANFITYLIILIQFKISVD